MYQIVLLRHGQSIWNQSGHFTGWVDVKLSPKGEQEALQAAKLLSEKNFQFDYAFSSSLQRAIRTLWIILEKMQLMWIPIEKDWHLNERHYGSLQGLSKTAMAEKYGAEQVHIWRRSYDVPPPPLKRDSEYNTTNEAPYAKLNQEELPLTESLADTVKRIIPFWENSIIPRIQAGNKIIISAHGNSLRALIKYLNKVSDEEISNINIPTAKPLICKLDSKLQGINYDYL